MPQQPQATGAWTPPAASRVVVAQPTLLGLVAAPSVQPPHVVHRAAVVAGVASPTHPSVALRHQDAILRSPAAVLRHGLAPSSPAPVYRCTAAPGSPQLPVIHREAVLAAQLSP